MDASEDRTSNPLVAEGAPTIYDVIERRLTRRGFVAGVGASVGALAAGCSSAPRSSASDAPTRSRFEFEEIARGVDGEHHAPAGYDADVLIRWGDPVFADAPTFVPRAQTAAAQRRQIGYNNDFIGFHPLQDDGRRGLLCVNHEYTSTRLMFPELEDRALTKAECEVELEAHGGTIVEIAQDADGKWRPLLSSKFNRRITAGSTPMALTGPAAGSDRLKTSADATGRAVIGTLNNCAGGLTPWGAYLMAEENFNGNFLGELAEDDPEAANHQRYGVPGGWYQWGEHFDRFDVSKEPNEPNRFGWVVEVDILDPTSTPKKRTALGRFKHEGAESVVAPSGQVVVYMGDDQRFDYVYKFVTARAFDPGDRAANRDLLDDGVLSVARFNADGTLDWLPLVFGEGPLTPENGFTSQADVLVETRRAADVLGATPMDRPEDVEPDPRTGRVFVMLTNNTRRDAGRVDAANPRADNAFGHIIEIVEPDGDFAATRSTWEILVRCGDPEDPAVGAAWHATTSENGWFGSPDNCALDPMGRLWVATDGNQASGANDGLWALETDGPLRGAGKAFFRAPTGAEVCGPRFSPDGETLFLAVQHPGDGEGATFENPTTRWPDFADDSPPRPSVLAIRKSSGGPIGACPRPEDRAQTPLDGRDNAVL
ncbi:MAG: PhoX family phosphatase [Parvularculaceae bacterium]